MKRTLYFGNPAHLSTKNEQLIIKRDNHSDTSIPIEDIGFVILDHYDISITKTDRKRAALFRRLLLKDGFSHIQHSVYLRHCASRENAELHIKRVKSFLPPKGTISIIRITDKQFGMIESFYGHSSIPPPLAHHQLEMF